VTRGICLRLAEALFLRDLTDRERADREHLQRVDAERERDARAAAEAALRASEDRLQRVLTAARMGTWEWDLEANHLTGSHQAGLIHGVAHETFGGRPDEVLAVIHPDDRHRLRHLLRSLQRGSDQVDLEYRVLWSDRSVHWVAAQGQVFRRPDGRPTRVTGVAMDITDRKLAEQQARSLAQGEKLRALGQMASGIAHDLNQSLALISGYAELARQELDATVVDREHLRALFEVAVKAAMDAGQGVRRLLAFARTQDVQACERIAAGELLREVADLTLPRWRDVAQAEGRPISLEVDAGDDLLWGCQSRPGRLEASGGMLFR
jgi:PAS domain S-box-containing protein